MTLRHLATAAETHLDDLQADMEAGSRQIDQIHDAGAKIRDALVAQELEQAPLMRSLVKRLIELRACLQQQRETMRQLRHDIRRMRAFANR
jgi:hypothetical protein